MMNTHHGGEILKVCKRSGVPVGGRCPAHRICHEGLTSLDHPVADYAARERTVKASWQLSLNGQASFQ